MFRIDVYSYGNCRIELVLARINSRQICVTKPRSTSTCAVKINKSILYFCDAQPVRIIAPTSGRCDEVYPHHCNISIKIIVEELLHEHWQL